MGGGLHPGVLLRQVLPDPDCGVEHVRAIGGPPPAEVIVQSC